MGLKLHFNKCYFTSNLKVINAVMYLG